MIILLNIPTAAHVIVLAKFHSRVGCFNAGIIQVISYIIQLRYTTSRIEELLEITTDSISWRDILNLNQSENELGFRSVYLC